MRAKVRLPGTMSFYKSFVKNNSLVLSGHLLVQARSLIIIPVLIKAAGVSIYGGYVLVISLLSLAFGLSSLGVGFKFKRFLPSAEGPAAARGLFYPQFYFQLASVAAIAGLFFIFEAPLKAAFFKDQVAFSIWLVPLFLLTYTAYSQVTDYFRYSGRMAYFTYATTSVPYASLGLMLLGYFLTGGIGVNLLLAAECLAMALVTLPILWVMLREIGFGLIFFGPGELRTDMKVGFPLLLTYMVDYVLSAGDRYIIALYLSSTFVGYYAPAYALGTMIVLLPKVSGVVLPQLLSKAVDEGHEEKAATMVTYMVKGYLMVAVPFVAGAALFSRQLLTVLGNPEVAARAWLVTPVVALATLFYGLNIIMSNIFFVRMRTAELLKWNVISAALNIALNLIFIYVFKNILVAAFTTLISYAGIFVPLYLKSRGMLPFQVGKAAVFKPLVASLAMCAVILSWRPDLLGAAAMPLPRLLDSFLAASVIYAGVLAATGFITRKELVFLRELVLQ